MKKNNRLVALLMAAAMMLTAVACDSSPASSNPPAPSESLSPSSAVPESSSAVLTAPDKEYVKGVTTDNEYVSEFWGIKFTSPDKSITLATAEQLLPLLGFATEAMGTDPALEEQIKAQMELYEMAAIDMGSGVMLMMMSVELPVAGVSGEIYIKGILEGLKMAGNNTSFELDNDGISTKETIAGKEFTCVGYTMKAGENIPESHQTQRILVDGKRALIISTTYPPAIEAAKDTEAALVGAITAIE